MIKGGQYPQGVIRLNKKQFISELIKKLSEEFDEFKHAKDKESIADEISDIEEVLSYLKKELKITDLYIKKLRKEKIKERGDFDKRIFVKSVGIPRNNKWFKYYVNNPDKYPEIKKKTPTKRK